MRILIILFISIYLNASSFNLIKKDSEIEAPTLLIIGGIHGNEPGGFFAPAILSQYYSATKGSIWIVPNLNKPSIQAQSRGIYGDMNRKFAPSTQKDGDSKTIEDIKKLILNDRVSLVLNLHDGHGFYRKDYKNTIFNANAWGQTCVIDQCQLEDNSTFGNLDEIASKVSADLNAKLLKEHHTFNVRNTKTKFYDEQMKLSLTYFSVTHNKPAFAIETSKNLSSLAQKVYYQLNAIESFMKIMGIEFKRDFELTIDNIEKLLVEYGSLKINDNLLLPLNDIRKILSYVPLKSKSNKFEFSHPLGSVKKINNRYDIYIGDRRVVLLYPQYFNMVDCPKNIRIKTSSTTKNVPIASKIIVKDDFSVLVDESFRVNVIGYSNPNKKNESNIVIKREDMIKRFSIDNSESEYRVEFYKDNKYCGMIVVKFSKG